MNRILQKGINYVLILSFMFFLSGKVVNAERVSVKDAAVIAKNYYFKKSGLGQSIKYSNLDLQVSYIGIDILDTVYYAFSDYENNAYVIISADDKVNPVLAFSNSTVFSGIDIPPACKYMLDSYSEQIVYAKQTEYVPENSVAQKWLELASLTNSELRITETPSTPLILSHWNQRDPYNEYCPVDIDGPGGNVLVGCVAISMGQIMKYYNYPPQGSGSNSYYASGYGIQSVNFGNSTYEFYNMPNVTNESNSDLAEFLYHCGVGAEMNYGIEGSGAWVSTACQAMEDNFHYSPNWEYDNRNSFTDSQWRALIENEIDNLRPMIYVGYTSSSGHAWNCDGYQNDLFHMNWGWGGSYDGFFSLDNLVAGGLNFYTGHKVASKLYPGENYPEYCGSVTEIWGTEGSFDDGSGPEKYNNGTDCFWEVMPECGQNIYLEFDFFDVKIGDTLFVYDGLTTESPLLAQLTGENVIPDDLFSDKGGVLLNFVTNNDSIASGWTISYTVDFCKGSRNITEISGTLNDGSGDCNYKDASMCNWVISPPNTDSIFIDFTEFNLFPDIDNVKIYSGVMNSANLIGKYTGSSLPPEIMIYSDEAIVYFFSNSTGNFGGWTLDYEAYTNSTGISEVNIDEQLLVYPNPVLDIVNIYLNSNSNSSSYLNIYNSIGEIIYSENVNLHLMENVFSVDFSNYPSGMYFVQINSGVNKISQRFIKQ